MSLLDLAYIIIPPVLALAIAGVIVWTGDRSTDALDAEIAAYRARKTAEREAAKPAEEVRAATTSRAAPSFENMEAILRRLKIEDGISSGPVNPVTLRAVREAIESGALGTSPGYSVEPINPEWFKLVPRGRRVMSGVRVRRDASTGQMVVISNPPYFPSRTPAT